MKGGWSSEIKKCKKCGDLFRARSNPKTKQVKENCPRCLGHAGWKTKGWKLK
ncbi:MAG: hypothetical protein GTN97_03300 [Nitrosopumilaceae archaeon]|nr:hypothetical protein [Nitrosopumilaceae archaeon]